MNDYSIKNTTSQGRADIAGIIFNFFTKNKKYSAGYLLLLLAYPISDVILPHYYGKIIDTLSNSSKMSLNIFKIILFLWIISQLAMALLDTLDAYFLPKLLSYIRKEIIKNIINSHSQNYKELHMGKLLSHIIKLPLVINDLFHQTRTFIIPTILVCLTAVIYLYYINKHIGLMLSAGLIIFVFIIIKFAKKCIIQTTYKDTEYNKLHDEIEDTLNNLINIYSAGNIREEIKRLDWYQTLLNNKLQTAIKCSSQFKLIFSVIYFTLFSAIQSYSFYLYSSGKIKLHTFISILFVILFLLGYLDTISNEIRDFVFNLGTVNKTQEYLNKLYNKNKSGNFPNNSKLCIYKFGKNYPQNYILFRNVKIYKSKNNKLILDINYLNIYKNDDITIIGHIGSGKSTLIKALFKLLPYDGNIYFQGINIKYINTNKFRNLITYVPQNPKLFNRSIYENIIYGSTKNNITENNIINLIKKFNIDTLPNINYKVGKSGSKLSGGQRQLIMLLRSIISNKSIIILDEPTTSLDKKNKKLVIFIIKYLMKNKTVITITHDPEIIKNSNRIIEMKSGRIISDKSK